jgi:hypothetical protein
MPTRGHRRNDAGERDRELESARSVSSMDDVGGGDIAVCLCDAPQHRHDDKDKGIYNDRVARWRIWSYKTYRAFAAVAGPDHRV